MRSRRGRTPIVQRRERSFQCGWVDRLPSGTELERGQRTGEPTARTGADHSQCQQRAGCAGERQQLVRQREQVRQQPMQGGRLRQQPHQAARRPSRTNRIRGRESPLPSEREHRCVCPVELQQGVRSWNERMKRTHGTNPPAHLDVLVALGRVAPT